MKGFKTKPTTKQLEIIELLARDYTVPEIAAYLDKSVGDVEKFIARSKDILGVKTAQGLVAEAHRKRHIDISRTKKIER